METAHLLLTAPDATDWPPFRALLADPRVHATLGGPQSEEEMRAAWDRVCAHWTAHGFGLWCVRDRASGAWLGHGGVRHHLMLGAPVLELVYAYTAESWGRGVATEVARAAVAWAFEGLGAPALVARTLATNAGSRRVMEKCGMRADGEFEHRGLPHVRYVVTRADAMPPA